MQCTGRYLVATVEKNAKRSLAESIASDEGNYPVHKPDDTIADRWSIKMLSRQCSAAILLSLAWFWYLPDSCLQKQNLCAAAGLGMCTIGSLWRGLSRLWLR